jgi:hypothetical protein
VQDYFPRRFLRCCEKLFPNPATSFTLYCLMMPEQSPSGTSLG